MASLSVTIYECVLHIPDTRFVSEHVLVRYIITLPAEYRFYRAFYRNNYRITCQPYCLNAKITQLTIYIAPAWSYSYLTGQPFPLSLRASFSEVGHRYLNIIMPALGGWEFFSHKFTAESCHKLFLLPTVFRGSFSVSWVLLRRTKWKTQCFWVWCHK